MNKEFLSKRIDEYNKRLEEINQVIQKKMADLNLIIGQKNECILLIAELDKPKYTVINEEPISLDDLKKLTGATEISVVENG